ncbi:hypothetical protein [Edaphobacter flagellatus]|uniref:hypothetical protein n=1 Tax=Edaphobacter flagellatus TaxID=1933044 RepID=UPI0021B26131|nr:hypothetical protein [Edaphobacter flagellatus]
MLSGVIVVAAAQPEPPPEHTFALWAVAILSVLLCSALFLLFIALTKSSWSSQGDNLRSIARERAEKSCDTVLSVCTFAITATLGLITWLNDKVGPGAYLLPLIAALLYFFILLAFTIHLRFNFFWRREEAFLVSSDHNARFAYWLTTATSAIVLGLVLLAVPVLELGLGWLRLKPPAPLDLPPIKVEVTCPPPPVVAPPPPPPPCKPVKHHHRPKPICACKK